jgi:hypothetical protein
VKPIPGVLADVRHADPVAGVRHEDLGEEVAG